MNGAEKLLGKGDMLFYAGVEMERIQCAYVSTDEIDKITKFIESQNGYLWLYNSEVPLEGVIHKPYLVKYSLYGESPRDLGNRKMVGNYSHPHIVCAEEHKSILCPKGIYEILRMPREAKILLCHSLLVEGGGNKNIQLSLFKLLYSSLKRKDGG